MENKPLWSGPKKPTVNSGTQPNNSVQAKAKRGDKDGKKDGHAINDQIHAKEVRLVGEGPIMDINLKASPKRFIDRGGKIPAPMQSLKN